VRVYTLNNGTWTQTGTDIDGEATGDKSGSSVAMSADGTRIAIGAPFNNGSGTSGSTDDTGHVRVYTLNNGTWTQTGTDIDGEATGDNSGSSVAMSGDGTRIAIGAPLNNGKGHARVYTLNNGTWTQTGTDIDGEATGDASGYSVAMSGDGSRIAIGAPFNNGKGHARVYTLNNGTWTQTGTDIDGEAAGDASGYSVAMSTNGSRIAIGALWNDNDSADIGHVRVYAVLATPAAPTISSVSAADGSFTVVFTPGTDGGSPIMNYKYSIDGTNYIALNPAATTSPFTVSGLTNGTTYSVTIKAVNGLGDSPTSNAVIGTPVAPTTTVAPATTTTAAPTTTIATTITASVNKVIETNGELPKAGNNSSPLMTFATILLSAGLVIVTRRRITS
jgi:LPXTG-motif cell wall-anchored protein